MACAGWNRTGLAVSQPVRQMRNDPVHKEKACCYYNVCTKEEELVLKAERTAARLYHWSCTARAAGMADGPSPTRPSKLGVPTAVFCF